MGRVVVHRRHDRHLNRVYQEHLPEPRPARSLVLVSRLKGPDMLVEIEAIGVVTGDPEP
ncbi:RidA family protein [Streptomyces sp. NPDC058405]|uniref:RidA family protein n=1 Tax=unclassified Streptomyces TaxID=2593676 RepID=UPI003665F239